MESPFTQLLLIVGLIFFIACSNKSGMIHNSFDHKTAIPPGTIQIDDNLFADERSLK